MIQKNKSLGFAKKNAGKPAAVGHTATGHPGNL
jgi:hypothetical protein